MKGIHSDTEKKEEEKGIIRKGQELGLCVKCQF